MKLNNYSDYAQLMLFTSGEYQGSTGLFYWLGDYMTRGFIFRVNCVDGEHSHEKCCERGVIHLKQETFEYIPLGYVLKDHRTQTDIKYDSKNDHCLVPCVKVPLQGIKMKLAEIQKASECIVVLKARFGINYSDFIFSHSQ